jgi:hypothetical protein
MDNREKKKVLSSHSLFRTNKILVDQTKSCLFRCVYYTSHISTISMNVSSSLFVISSSSDYIRKINNQLLLNDDNSLDSIYEKVQRDSS